MVYNQQKNKYQERIMQNDNIRKDFGRRLKQLRKQKKWSQKELASELNAKLSILNKYECGLHIPPAEKLIKLAEIFNTTVDYLLTGNQTDVRPLHNLRLLERFRALDNFNTDDQEAIIKLIDALIVKNQVEGVIKPHLKA